MLGDLVTSGLVLAFGYAYPALECFKAVVKNRVEIEELRFWCQYWIIVAVITMFERIGDIFVSWLPMYGEAKLALFIYLWYPKTKGCGYVFDTVLLPYVAKHETDIERWLQEFRSRAMDLAIYYWQNCTELGQTKFFEVLQYLASPSANVVRRNSENAANQFPIPSTRTVPPPSAPPSTLSSLFRKHKQPSSRAGRPPMPPPSPTSRRIVAQSPKAEIVQVHLDSQTEFIHVQDTTILDEDNGPDLNDTFEQNGVDQKLQAARLRLRRSKASSPQHK